MYWANGFEQTVGVIVRICARGYAARKDPAFMEVLVRHVRHKGALIC